jgi:Fe-S-cluster containining protein
VLTRILPSVRALSLHSRYRCQDSGACCSTGWAIEIESDRLVRLDAAVRSGVLALASGATLNWMKTGDSSVLPMRDGRCGFFDEPAAKHCRVHHALGHEALPLACRQFPRVVVRDPFSVSVTLSHFCPTAAALLKTEDQITITDAPPAFPSSAEYDGLDATDGLPPLLRPDMAMDWASWREFERLSVALLVEDSASAEVSLGRLGHAVEALRLWSPANGDLLAATTAAFTAARQSGASADLDVSTLYAELRDAIPKELRASVDAPQLDDGKLEPRMLKHFLAAHAFANWTAHLGTGLRTWLRSIHAAYAAAVHTSSVRQADLMLRHLADLNRLTASWGCVESPRVRQRRRRRSVSRSIGS